MAGPFDYTIDIQSPFTSLTQGLQLGAGIADIRAQQQARELKMQQEQAALEQQRMMQQEVQGFLTNPTAQGVLRLSTLMPAEQAKSIREGWAALDADTAKQRLSQVSQVSSALMSSTPEVGINMLMDMAEGARNAGKEDEAKQYEAYAETAKVNPRFAALTALVPMAGTEEGKRAIETMITAQKAPAEIREGEAKATTAEVAAKYAEPKAIQDMEKAGWDIKKLKQDVEFRPLELNLRRLEAQTARENAGLTRQALQLKVDDARRQYEQAIADRRASAQSAQIGIVDMRQSVSDLRNHSGFSSLFGASWVPGARFIPGSDTAGAEAVLESLKARAFIVGVDKMRGLGALGEKEGAKIEAAIGVLRPGMPEKDALNALSAIETSLNRLDELNQQKYGAPPASSFAGGEEPMVDTVEEYNALPSGAIYIDKLDGKKYRKP